jgi:hypothetical protein
MEAHELAGVEGAVEAGVDSPVEPLAERPFRVRVVL